MFYEVAFTFTIHGPKNFMLPFIHYLLRALLIIFRLLLSPSKLVSVSFYVFVIYVPGENVCKLELKKEKFSIPSPLDYTFQFTPKNVIALYVGIWLSNFVHTNTLKLARKSGKIV